MLVFIVVLVASLVRGRRPECHCFGQLHSAPIGATTLLRNVVLRNVVLAVGPSVVGWLGDVTTEERVGLAVGSEYGKLARRLQPEQQSPTAVLADLPIGLPAPAFSLVDLAGEVVTMDGLRAHGKPVVLLFTNPICASCDELLPDIGRWQRDHTTQLTIAVVSVDSLEVNRAKNEQHRLKCVLLQRDQEVFDAYHAGGMPSAVIVLPDGTIGSSVAIGAPDIRNLVAKVTKTPPAPAELSLALI